MNEPFIYIASHQVKPGRVEEARHRLHEVAELAKEHEPQLAAFHFYLDEERERVVVVQVHPDSGSMATHMRVIAEHLASAWDWLDQNGAETTVLGTPPDELVRYARDFGETLEVYPTHVAGFTRPSPAQARA
jgi:hypothetical protein